MDLETLFDDSQHLIDSFTQVLRLLAKEHNVLLPRKGFLKQLQAARKDALAKREEANIYDMSAEDMSARIHQAIYDGNTSQIMMLGRDIMSLASANTEKLAELSHQENINAGATDNILKTVNQQIEGIYEKRNRSWFGRMLHGVTSLFSGRPKVTFDSVSAVFNIVADNIDDIANDTSLKIAAYEELHGQFIKAIGCLERYQAVLNEEIEIYEDDLNARKEALASREDDDAIKERLTLAKDKEKLDALGRVRQILATSINVQYLAASTLQNAITGETNTLEVLTKITQNTLPSLNSAVSTLWQGNNDKQTLRIAAQDEIKANISTPKSPVEQIEDMRSAFNGVIFIANDKREQVAIDLQDVHSALEIKPRSHLKIVN